MSRSIFAIPLIGPFLRLVWRLMLDKRVPIWNKSLPLLALAYIVMPFDIRPDIVPVLGQVDDLMVAGLLLLAFVLLSPWQAIVNRTVDGAERGDKSKDTRGKVVDGTFRFLDPE